MAGGAVDFLAGLANDFRYGSDDSARTQNGSVLGGLRCFPLKPSSSVVAALLPVLAPSRPFSGLFLFLGEQLGAGLRARLHQAVVFLGPAFQRPRFPAVGT